MHLSPDGLIRLTVDQLLSTPLKHLVSGVDMDGSYPATACGTQTSLSGYTEWVSTKDPTISIGWDWCLQVSVTGVRWVRVGLPRSNLMLTQDSGYDTSWHSNLEILGTVVDALAWREILPTIVATRYS
ncbi:MAG: DUF4902 domain-containing protein [Pseudomonadota bacterium]